MKAWLRRDCAMWVPTAFPPTYGSSSSPSKKTTSLFSCAVVDMATLFLCLKSGRSHVRNLAGLGVLGTISWKVKFVGIHLSVWFRLVSFAVCRTVLAASSRQHRPSPHRFSKRDYDGLGTIIVYRQFLSFHRVASAR